MLFDDLGYVLVINLLVDVAVHESSSIVVLDIPFVLVLWNSKVLREPLLLEVLHSMVVGIGQEIVYVVILAERLQDIHEPSAVALDLLSMSDG